jgi:hypothetical protein
MTGAIRQQRIKADNMFAGQVVVYDLFVQGFIVPVWTVATFDLWLITDSGHPFVMAGNGITRSALGVFPASGKDICPPPEETSKNFYLLR